MLADIKVIPSLNTLSNLDKTWLFPAKMKILHSLEGKGIGGSYRDQP
jgi:hypothetical protein